MTARVRKADLFASLPPVWREDVLPRIRDFVAQSRRKVVVLDDDPTGTQTVHDVPVLTTWQPEELAREFANDLPCFYLLTNTRAFPTAEAIRINREIAGNLIVAARKTPGRGKFVVVSRSDSTLRGHFPAETDALAQVLAGGSTALPVLIVPYFEAGGRYTVGNIHYVAEGEELIPAAETPFAQDAAFGYRHSDLRLWVEEKTGGAVRATNVATISIEDLRCGGPEVVCGKLLSLRPGDVCIANAAAPRDLEVLAWAALQAEEAGNRLIYRTAASFVAARIGLRPGNLWLPETASVSQSEGDRAAAKTQGGLIMVGSYVPKTTTQLATLLEQCAVERVEVPVADVLNPAVREEVVTRSAARATAAIRSGRDVVVFTSRQLITGARGEASLAVGNQISEALVELLQRIEARPRYVIAKGGITSSDLATRGLGVKRAMVLGQILPGVPVWKLGAETRYPDLPYVVFPGNVGGPEALASCVKKFRPNCA